MKKMNSNQVLLQTGNAEQNKRHLLAAVKLTVPPYKTSLHLYFFRRETNFLKHFRLLYESTFRNTRHKFIKYKYFISQRELFFAIAI